MRRTRSELELRREAYRTALDAGIRPARFAPGTEPPTRPSRRRAQTGERARRAEAAARPAATAAQARVSHDVEQRRDRQELVIFLLRTSRGGPLRPRRLPAAHAAARQGLPLVSALGLGGALRDRLRLRRRRRLPDRLLRPVRRGILLLSLIGVAATVVAFWLLQRYLARRLPLRRVRRRQCPYCGFPVDDNERCEGCGREVQAACAHCAAPRRIGAPFCGACGRA